MAREKKKKKNSGWEIGLIWKSNLKTANDKGLAPNISPFQSESTLSRPQQHTSVMSLPS
jgi:hypothetical protein